MKKSIYLNVIKGEQEYLLHNTLHGTLAKAKCITTRSIVDGLEEKGNLAYDDGHAFHRFLKDLNMIVPNDVDERSLLNYHFIEANKDVLQIILFVTRQCNFRCTYCYEKHENKRMDARVYDNLMQAIKIKVSAQGYKAVVLSFFGGEPMLEYDNICSFMKNMLEFADKGNISIYGSMTTNAYLLTQEKLKKLVGLKIQNYQITVDGLKETHDSKRCLVGGGGTWERIVENLKDAKSSELDFEITLRTNFEADASETIKDYLAFVSSNFADDKRFKIHLEAIKNLGGESGGNSLESIAEDKAFEKILSIAKEMKLRTSLFNFNFAPFGYMCYASKNSSIAIDTDGTLRKCTVDIDSAENAVGKLSDRGFEIEDTRTRCWTSYELPKECHECKILPLCYGRKCPSCTKGSSGCDATYCSTIRSYYENSIRYYYQVC